jgi:hypothetical protein
MKHNLVEFHLLYTQSRNILGVLNKLKANKKTKSFAMRRLNRTRTDLLREIQRVSRLVWPETGRPFMGKWQVTNLANGMPVSSGSIQDCIAFIDRSKYGKYYRIDRWGTAAWKS